MDIRLFSDRKKGIISMYALKRIEDENETKNFLTK